MLATSWDAPFSDDEWVFELKWDGIRCLFSSAAGDNRLHSRAGNDMTARYPELARLDLPGDVVLDGEIVALDESGRPSFELLQSRMNLDRINLRSAPVPVTYVVFDLLHHRESLVELALERRMARLNGLTLPFPMVRGDRYRADSQPVWDFAVGNEMEGIVAKRLGSRYQPGIRSVDWRKIGNFKQMRAVVGGFTEGSGGRSSTFGALLLGLWTDAGLRWIGSVGSGFDDTQLQAIRSALDEMSVRVCPFTEGPALSSNARWVDPHLVAMIRYKQWTVAGRLRAPSFKGFTDTPSADATWIAEGPGWEQM
jgi:bifunctional non-homologous end joining protein LigD